MTARRRGKMHLPTQWSEKHDRWLAEVLRGDDAQDVNTAMQRLQAKYRDELREFVQAKLPNSWVDDTVQEIWISFYQQARVQEIRDVAAYLRGIAHNIRAREVGKLTRERQCELDIPPADDDELTMRWAGTGSIEEMLEDGEARVVEDHQLDLLRQLPFIDAQLWDCQRIYWALRTIYRYPSKAVGRLLGRSSNNIDVQTNKARRRSSAIFKVTASDLPY